ncbi:MAG: DNA repair exonuclease [Thermomicrobiales bacterium]
MNDTIRIAHLSDTHLGYRAYAKVDPASGRNQRTIDVEQAFTRAIDSILDLKPDIIIHAGDVFHQSRPSWHAIRHFVREMRRIENAGIPTLVIAGNHDTPRLRTDGSVYSVLELALPAIRFVADYDLVTETNEFAQHNVRVQALPHGALTNDDPPLTRVASGKRNILVSHGVVPGAMPENAHGEPGEQYLDANLLDPEFDYIALGHYHVYSEAKPRTWYSGSTERFGFGDADASPGYAMVELGDNHEFPNVRHIDIDARPMLSLEPLYGGLKPARDIADQILGKLEHLGQLDAMVSISLRDIERPVRREVESIVRRESPSFVWLAHFIAERQMLLDPETSRETIQTADLRTLFAQFVQEKTGSPLTKDFATRFLERGDRALEHALLTAEPDESDGGAT